MKRTTLLAYRNNNTWQALQDALLDKATSVAARNKSELVVNVFQPTDGPEVIDQWIVAVKAENEIVHAITDGTVSNRMSKAGFDMGWEFNDNLNGYLDIRHMEELAMPLEEVIRTAYLRLSEAVKPDLWVIVVNNLSDYDIFKIMGKEKYNEEVTDADRAAHVEKFRSLIPTGQTVEVFPYSGWHNPTETFNRDAIRGKKVVMICHHHAVGHLKPGPLDGTLQGSLCLDTYPSAFLPKVSSVIRVDDIIGGDVIGKIRQRLLRHN